MNEARSYVMHGVAHWRSDCQWSLLVTTYANRGGNWQEIHARLPLDEVVDALLANPEALGDVIDALALGRARQLAESVAA